MSAFKHIDTWVFDLDNTLYPASCRLFDQIDVKMGEFVSRTLNISYADAKKRQKELFYKHGTTLRGLMQEHGQRPEGFLDYVHNIDYSSIAADPLLGQELEKLPGRRLVFTAGTVAHATRAMDQLGVTHLFDDIYDIVHADYVPKPQRAPYETFIKAHDVDPKRSAFFEDIARNLEVPHAMGMVTVLIKSDDNRDANHLNEGADAAHVHHVTDHLAGFLKHVNDSGRHT
jgi:putative hydrolase of the HAD superfamily